ncbi:Acetyltransferase (GNAT) family protein [Lachnospiraceae bacterium XBB1006]|nr:Acetyltransferase (GNAT) family protein [Lachnospiraceae bacterium XBB1006]
MELAIAQAKENGMEQLELGVFSDNDRARHLYQKYGFKEYGVNPRAFKLQDGSYRDEIIMVKMLKF